MAAAGPGVSVVPEMALEEPEGCRFVPLADDSAYRRVGIVQLKQHFRSRVHRAFLEHLRQGQEQRDVPLRFKRVAVWDLADRYKSKACTQRGARTVEFIQSLVLRPLGLIQ